jgi:peptide/nickel transport system permease protein
MNVEKPSARPLNPFARFLLKKLIFLLAAIFLSFTLVFILPYFMPSSPVDMMIDRMKIGKTPQQIIAIRQKYTLLFGLDQPLIVQYGLFWKRVLTLNFGDSMAYPSNTVLGVVGYGLIWTLILIIPAWILSFIVGNNYLGTQAAFSKNILIHTFYTLAVYLNSAPYYWFGLILVYAVGVNLRWFPVSGAYSNLMTPSLSLNFILDVGYHYVLPFLSLFITGIGNWCTGMRAMTIYEKQSDYIYYSRQMGFKEGKLREYAQKNALLPQVTGLPIMLSILIGQTMIVEFVFGWPGLGTVIYNAVTKIDYPLMQAVFVFTVLLVLIGNFLMDVVYGFIDPRIRTGYVGG